MSLSENADQRRKSAAEYARMKRLGESEEQTAVRRAKNREAARIRRENETPEEKRLRQEQNAQAARKRRLLRKAQAQSSGSPATALAAFETNNVARASAYLEQASYSMRTGENCENHLGQTTSQNSNSLDSGNVIENANQLSIPNTKYSRHNPATIIDALVFSNQDHRNSNYVSQTTQGSNYQPSPAVDVKQEDSNNDTGYISQSNTLYMSVAGKNNAGVHEQTTVKRNEAGYDKHANELKEDMIASSITLALGAIEFPDSALSSNVDYSRKINKCDVCGKGFMHQATLKRHMLLHSGETPHVCKVCGKGFALKTSFQQHQKLHAGIRPHQCDDCGQRFVFVSHLKEHKKKHSGEKPFVCFECGRSFASSYGLKRHSQLHMTNKPFGCDVCGKRFAFQGSLNQHQKIHSGERKHECDVCGQRFVFTSHLKQHKNTHLTDKAFACPDCDKTFRSALNLKKHSHIHAEHRPYQCNVCGKRFPLICSLNQHQKIHLTDRPHECDECGQRFLYGGHLTEHKKKHGGEKSFGCSECNKKFLTSSLLKRHLAKHTQVQTFECSVCSKEFAQEASLNEHKLVHQECSGRESEQQRTHTTERSYTCTHCGESFESEASLKSHAVIHTEMLPFVCDVCGNRFASSGALQQHERTQHKELQHYEQYNKYHTGDVSLQRHTHQGERGNCFAQPDTLQQHLHMHSAHQPGKGSEEVQLSIGSSAEEQQFCYKNVSADEEYSTSNQFESSPFSMNQYSEVRSAGKRFAVDQIKAYD